VATLRDIRQFGRLLGARLVELRLGRKQTQEQCAADAGLSKAYLSQLEGGKRLPSLEMLQLIAENFKVELRDLMPRWRPGEAVVHLPHEDGSAYATLEMASQLEQTKGQRKLTNRAASDDGQRQRARRSR
jgi:transcriptional regulator with XRE-family HTH domain